MEKEVEVKTVEVRQYCDKCGEEMRFTGETLLSNPPKYVHKCNKCGNSTWCSKSYPCIEYREVKKNPITVIDLSDDFKETLKHVKQVNENKNNMCKHDELTFSLNSVEVEEYKKFVNEHKECNCSATIGGKISVIFTPTGLGDAKSVKCNACGQEKEITDVSNW